MVGQTISHYRIERKLGAGGMGEVYLAFDRSLDRSVALKILPSEFVSNPERLRRFIREAKAASAINHPNVAHIYEIGEENGLHYIAMEFVEGESLAARMTRIRISSDNILNIAQQIIEALQEAHGKGIIHRDIKPANIMISSTGRVKLVDFGLAKIHQEETDISSRLSTASQTELGIVMGTLPYMSPEQLLGRAVDHRTDFFSLGVVLYELATSKLPFQGNTATELADAILHKNPISVQDLNRQLPDELERTILKMLAKEPAMRPENAGELLADLQKLSVPQAGSTSLFAVMRRPSIAFPALVLILALAAVAFWLAYRYTKIKWAREEALLQIAHLADEAKYEDAVRLAFEAEEYIPNDPLLKTLWVGMSLKVSVQTDPTGADVHIQEYESTGENWKLAGKSPIHKLRLPKGYYRLKITKPGYPEIITVTPRSNREQEVNLSYDLERSRETPKGMVRIPGARHDPESTDRFETVPVQDDYWMDQWEVTNKDFQKFVENGGYRNRQYWKVPFIKDGKELSFEEAMTYFRDATGRPGPLEWEVGRFPALQDEYPVTGVSWHEAAAYAEFAGKNLPTIHHWYHAAGSDMNYQIIPFSNFGGQGPHAAGNSRSMSPYGTIDMAGNVNEWCWNETSGGKRAILGGSYLEPVYMFLDLKGRSPFGREKTIGFRCVKYFSANVLSSAFSEPFEPAFRDYRKEKPVADEVFAALETFYDYEKKELNSRRESIEEHAYVIKEKVTFDASYGNERVIAYLFLPKNGAPPYQTVVYFPGAGAQYFSSSDRWLTRSYSERGDYLVRSGRAWVYTIYKGTYERGGGPGLDHATPDELREWRIQYVKDFRRTIDYLESRSDIDKNKLAYHGYSWGGRVGCIIGAVENRLKVMILEHGGFPPEARTPETDEINFAPHVGIPVLMINGSFDHVFPVETSQKPMFSLLGTPEQDKMHFIFEGGHTTPQKGIVRVVLDWLDKYLGQPLS